MPRIGITEAQMVAAITALQTRQEPITKITIRKELGDTGSYGTISAFLTRWRETQKLIEEVVPYTPIPDEVQQHLGLVWSMARTEARAELARERDVLAAEMADLRKEFAEAQTENDEAVRTLELQLVAQAAQAVELTAKEQTAQLRIAEQAERTGYLTARLEDAQKAKEAAEALMASVKFWIWSNRKKAWWEDGRSGYTEQRALAGVYTRADLSGACIEDLDKEDIPALRDVLVVKEGLVPILNEAD